MIMGKIIKPGRFQILAEGQQKSIYNIPERLKVIVHGLWNIYLVYNIYIYIHIINSVIVAPWNV